MKIRLQFLFMMILIAIIGMLLQGCASGVRLLGEIEIAPGLTRKYVQIGSEGHDSARLTIIESFDVTKEGIKSGSEYHATTDGLVGKIMEGTGAAIAQGGGYAAGVYLLRPNTFNSSTVQSGGGASATGTGLGLGGTSSSGSNSFSNQSQGQNQSLTDGNTNISVTAPGGQSGGCRGRCE